MQSKVKDDGTVACWYDTGKIVYLTFVRTDKGVAE